MALPAASLPPAVIPFLVIMNDEHYLTDHRNGRFGNTAVIAITVLSFVLAIGSLSRSLLKAVPRLYTGYRISWEQMDLSDAVHPRTTCRKEELRVAA